MPGSVDRLVQITGSVPTNVAQAKLLMEDTIRRNQSPTPTLDLTGNHPPAAGSTSAPNQEYKFSVKVGDELVKISSTNLQLVKASKIILDEYFTNNNMKVAVSRQPLFPNSTPEAFKLAEMSVDGAGHSQKRRENFARTAAAAKLGPEKKRYDRQFILKCAQSPYCAALPEKMEKILEEFPEITKKVSQEQMLERIESMALPDDTKIKEHFAQLMENCRVWNDALGQWTHNSTIR